MRLKGFRIGIGVRGRWDLDFGHTAGSQRFVFWPVTGEPRLGKYWTMRSSRVVSGVYDFVGCVALAVEACFGKKQQ